MPGRASAAPNPERQNFCPARPACRRSKVSRRVWKRVRVSDAPGLGCGRPKKYDPQRGQHRKKSRSYWAARSVFSFALRNGQRLQGQLLAALRTTTSQHLAAILRRHSLAEAMLLAALTLLGLISSQHLPHTSYYPKNLNGHRHRSNNQVSGLCRCLSVILRIRYIIVR